MNAFFWHDKWQKNEIGFHRSEANELLVKHWDALGVRPGARVFIPLCGKSLDIHWFLAKGYRVAGAELVDSAVQQLFKELSLAPEVTAAGPLKHYRAENLDIFSGDIFNLTAGLLGPVDAVYDRAALVALPPEMRLRYAKHIMTLTQRAPQLVICYEYDQSQMEGPPFSIPQDEILGHYGSFYRAELAERVDVPGGFKGRLAAAEHVWRLYRPASP